MKNIYVNGCSFSAGHDPLIDRNGKVWADYLKDNYHVINESLSGGSSFRSLRMCITTALEQNTSIDTIICQLTALNRGEIYIKEIEEYLAYQNSRFILEELLPKLKKMGFSHHPQSGTAPTMINQDGETLEEKYKHKWISYINIFLSNIADRQLHIIGLCNNLKILCEQRNIKLLFTAMSDQCIPRYPNDGSRYGIPIPYFIKPMSQIFVHQSMIESDTDAHPNEEGHKVIYRYILSELGKL